MVAELPFQGPSGEGLRRMFAAVQSLSLVAAIHDLACVKAAAPGDASPRAYQLKRTCLDEIYDISYILLQSRSVPVVRGADPDLAGREHIVPPHGRAFLPHQGPRVSSQVWYLHVRAPLLAGWPRLSLVSSECVVT